MNHAPEAIAAEQVEHFGAAGEVDWLDRDQVVVVQVSCVDPALRLGEDAQLVERSGDDLFVRVVTGSTTIASQLQRRRVRALVRVLA